MNTREGQSLTTRRTGGTVAALGTRPAADLAVKSEVFLCYSRQDLEAARAVRRQLEDSGISVWVDIDGLYAGEEFWPEVAKAIDAALAMVFVISPSSIASPYCHQELVRALDARKRIVPALHADVDAATLHPELAKRQWVLMRPADDPEMARTALLSAVREDWVQLREQARWFVRAQTWHTRHGDTSTLLRGRELREAEAWLAAARCGEDGATPLHGDYIEASRRATRRRLGRLAGSGVLALATLAAVTGYSLDQRVANLSNRAHAELTREWGQPQQAVDALERGQAICDRFGSIFRGCAVTAMNLGRAYLEVARYEEAVARYTKAIDGTPEPDAADRFALEERADLYATRAFAQIMVAELKVSTPRRLELYDLAESDLSQAAALQARTPMDASVRPQIITHARIAIGRGKYRQALQLLERARRLAQRPDVDLLLSVVHHCLGDGPRSVVHLQRYLDALPEGLEDRQWKLNRPYFEKLKLHCAAAAPR